MMERKEPANRGDGLQRLLDAWPNLTEWQKNELYFLAAWHVLKKDAASLLENPIVKLAALVLAVIVLAFVVVSSVI